MPDYSVPTIPILDSAQLAEVLPTIDSLLERMGNKIAFGPLFFFAPIKDLGHGTPFALPQPIDRLLAVAIGNDTITLIREACRIVEAADMKRAPLPPDPAPLHRLFRKMNYNTSLRRIFAGLEQGRCTVYTQSLEFPDMEDTLMFGFIRTPETVREVTVQAQALSRANDVRN